MGGVYHPDFKNISGAGEALYETEIVDFAEGRKRAEHNLTSKLEKELDAFFDKSRPELTNLSERIYRLNPSNPVALTSIALQKYVVGAWSVAVDYVNKALDIEPDNKYAMCALLGFFGNSPTPGYFSNAEMFDFAMKADSAHPDDPAILEHLLSLSIYQFREVLLAEQYYVRGARLFPARFKIFEGPVNRLKDRMNA